MPLKPVTVLSQTSSWNGAVTVSTRGVSQVMQGSGMASPGSSRYYGRDDARGLSNPPFPVSPIPVSPIPQSTPGPGSPLRDRGVVVTGVDSSRDSALQRDGLQVTPTFYGAPSESYEKSLPSQLSGIYFSKVFYLATLISKYIRALSLENL
jgi:hypothetical protein